MKLLTLTLCLLYVSAHAEVRFVGILKDERTNLPLEGAMVGVKQSGLISKNISQTDKKGVFIITFKDQALNSDFTLWFSKTGYKLTEFHEIVASIIVPKEYSL